MRFHIGQELVCISNGAWVEEGNQRKGIGPKYSEIVTVDSYFNDYALHLVGYNTIWHNGKRVAFTENNFAPLMDISELEEILQHESQPA